MDMCKQFNSFSKTPDLLATLTTSQGSSDQALIESTADSVFMDSLIDASVFADSSFRDGKLNFGQHQSYSWYPRQEQLKQHQPSEHAGKLLQDNGPGIFSSPWPG